MSSRNDEDPHAQTLGRLLLRAHRRFADRALALLQARGHTDLTIAHVMLLPHFDPDGTRSTVLASRAGITKQAAGQVVADLERAGYIERVSDESDARAVKLAFTRRGRQLVADAGAVKEEIDRQLGRVLGAGGLVELHELLTKLLTWGE